jgi:cytochrome c biogenesis protein CcmG, thiol:disulfide interchange protein DsbE
MRAGVLLLGVALLGCEAPPAGPPRLGGPAPEYSAVAMQGGQPVSLASLRGQVVLLNVWATWCHPCRREMPDLQRLHRERGPAGLRVVGVSIDERGQEAEISHFLGEFGITYPIWLDPEDQVSPTFALIGVPGTYLIDRGGILRWSHVGPVSADDPALRRALDAALGAARS